MQAPLIGIVLFAILRSEVYGGFAELRHSRRLLALPGGDETLLPRDEWVVQKLNHFDPSDGRTWWQRYHTNGTWFKKSRNSPVFLMISGEGPASAKWMTMGSWMDFAKKYNALCFQLEHRFYGKSLPTDSDSSVHSLRNLNSEQALADVANFVQTMNEKYKLSSTNRWIVFGGSYAGSLAAWARLKYPHLVHAAVSSSAPILAQADFKGYDDVVQQALSASSPACAANVKKAALLLETRLKSNDVEGLAAKFNQCSLNATNPFDVALFIDSLADDFRGAVQYSHDNRKPLNSEAIPAVELLCEIMTAGNSDLVDRLAAVHNLVAAGKCDDVKFEDFVQELRGGGSARSWYYQTCTEFGFYQTTSASMFGSLVNMDFFVETCKRVFGEDYNLDRMAKGIRRTNVIYGGLNIDVSRVLFVHGSLDPWHALGMTRSSKASTPVIYINGTAHCADMYPPTKDDPIQLVGARKEVEEHIGEWLSS